MTKEELIDFLKENLTINISSTDGAYYNSPSINVEIRLGKEVISSSSCSPPEKRDGLY